MSSTDRDEQDLTPQPNPIMAEPATVENCRADYDDAADVRARMDQQDKR